MLVAAAWPSVGRCAVSQDPNLPFPKLISELTLLRRLVRGEPFWAAHRSHFYQRATDNGFTVMQVVREVFALNGALAVLAIASTATHSTMIDVAFVIIGGIGVALTMFRFSRPRPA